MLRRLEVTNLAVVEKTAVDFADGLNVITGETGAGKSVLMGALDLVLGAKADSSIVRDGAKESEVEAEFAVDGKSTVIRRTVTKEGRSKAWIDDESVTLTELKEKASALVDIHGPRANQRLLEESFQREILDGFGGISLSGYEAAFKAYSEVRGRLAALEAESLNEDELELLRFQVNELEEAKVSPEDDDLAERHAAAAHAEEIVEAANEITEALGGDDGAGAVLAKIQPLFARAARHFPSANEWAEESEKLSLGIQELSRTIADAVSKIDADPDAFEELDKRLTVVNRLKRKYGDPVAALEKKRQKLEDFENREVRLEELRGECAAAEKMVRDAGAKLSASRTKAGMKLAKAVTEELKSLGFAKACFEVKLELIDPEAYGCDRVVYMFEPNPGESARPLSAIASSGEIARVMLALKTISKLPTSNYQLPTLVFDEIDANIGGEIGKVVGEKLRAVAATHQVIAITHLPQSAVFGERHLVVSKKVSGGRTRTTIGAVEGQERISEIARMLGGENLTSVAAKHAEELLALGASGGKKR